jgi:hypothetical protein
VSGGTEENHYKPEFRMAGALILKYVTEQGISTGDLVVVEISRHTVVSLLHLHFSAQVFSLQLTLEICQNSEQCLLLSLFSLVYIPS